MAKTTGVVIAIGGITMFNQSIVNNQPVDLRVPVATAIAAGFFALAEKGWEKGAVTLSYVALITILFSRVDPKTPAPLESLNTWMKKNGVI